MYIHLHEIDKGSFYLFIVLLSTAKNHSEKLKCFLNAPLDTLGSGVAACQLVLNCLEPASIQHI